MAKRLCQSIIIFVCSLASTHVQAFELGAGLAGVEEGDDRYRPASLFHLGFNDSVFARAYMYGRKHGPFTERTSLLSLNRRFPLFANKSNVTAAVGAAALLEQSAYKAQTDEEKNEHKDQYNAGVSFGCAYTLPLTHAYISFSWDAHLYLAGSAGVFLATGRKHTLGTIIGLRF